MRGDAAVFLASSRFTEVGLAVLIPISDCLPFDISLYDGKTFSKIQIKRAYPAKKQNKYILSLQKVFMNKSGAVKSYYNSNQVDFIVGV